MRFSSAALGGGRRFFVPRYVWTPAGGWWGHEPPNADANVKWVWFGMVAAVAAVWNFSVERERRPLPPQWHIPSQLWETHAAEDDPRLAPARDE